MMLNEKRFWMAVVLGALLGITGSYLIQDFVPSTERVAIKPVLSTDASGSMGPVLESELAPVGRNLIHRQDVKATPVILGTSRDGLQVVLELFIHMRSTGTAEEFAKAYVHMDRVDWSGTINQVADGISHLSSDQLEALTTDLLYDHLLDDAWREATKALKDAGVWNDIWVYTIQVKAVVCLPENMKVVETDGGHGEVKVEGLRFLIY